MKETSLSIKAITLTRAVFEAIHGNLGMLKFNIEELSPTNGVDGNNSMKWKVICSFFETLGSTSPSRYEVNVNLIDNTVAIKKLDIIAVEPEKRYTVKLTEELAPTPTPESALENN